MRSSSALSFSISEIGILRGGWIIGVVLGSMLKNLTQPMCIAHVDTISRHFQGSLKYGILQYLQEIRFHRLITGQKRFVFYKKIISGIILLALCMDI